MVGFVLSSWLRLEMGNFCPISLSELIGPRQIWLALRDITQDWVRAANHWKSATNQFAILYEDRFMRHSKEGAK